MNRKMLYATVAFAIVVISLTVVYSINPWTQTFEWQLNEQDFIVYSDVALTTEWTSGSNVNLGLANVNDTITINFYVKNTGGNAITITPSAITSAATVVWIPESTLIGVGGVGEFALNLTVIDAGSCSVSFTGV